MKGFFASRLQISHPIGVMNMRQGELRKTDQAPSDLLHGDACIFALLIIQLDPWL
jgi:hypothetical protein